MLKHVKWTMGKLSIRPFFQLQIIQKLRGTKIKICELMIQKSPGGVD